VKFLFISPRFSGGIGGHASMLADQLSKHGHKVTKMLVPHIPIKNLKNPSFAIFGALKGIVNRDTYDIVHAFNVPSSFAMHYTKGKKKVLSIHGVFSDQISVLHSKPASLLANTVELKALKWADKLTTDSRITHDEYKKKLGFDFEILPSAIDTKMFKQINEIKNNERQIIYVGRDSFEKGIDILKKIESKIDGKVVYCINIPWKDAMSKLKSSSILVVPSRMESLPTIIKEAFYLKIPVIATNVGGIPELITDNETGILIKSEDSDMLLEKIHYLLSNKSLQNSLTSKSFDFVNQNLTWDVVLPKYIDFYENLLAN
jgi:glycosyltransferase involved in cell wall biosynthesis